MSQKQKKIEKQQEPAQDIYTINASDLALQREELFASINQEKSTTFYNTLFIKYNDLFVGVSEHIYNLDKIRSNCIDDMKNIHLLYMELRKDVDKIDPKDNPIIKPEQKDMELSLGNDGEDLANNDDDDDELLSDEKEDNADNTDNDDGDQPLTDEEKPVQKKSIGNKKVVDKIVDKVVEKSDKKTTSSSGKKEVKPTDSKKGDKVEKKVEVKVEPKADKKTDKKSEVKPEKKVEPKADKKTEKKVEPKVEIKPEKKVEPKTETKKSGKKN